MADANPQLGPAEPSPDGTFLHSGTGAVMRVKGCAHPGRPGWVPYVSLRVRASDLGDATAMRKLATAYSRALGNSGECA
ncbi:hypothetical protein OIB37_26755 [Streptomyces sp. NBC_00820]|uniref:hypothetical protein n=1 Tax=Streptomyces sp. NBC_00820 TaxID=2975842 RepID=UPI002ED677A7|nr:hypothetical protein OIB37_26755 [Streptomyces sp. NBC_00820]